MKTRVFIATLALALLTALVPVGGDADAAPALKADNHPDHLQDDRGNGPAETGNGIDRKNPNGSNGTIKLDGMSIFGDWEAHPNNEPHIGCLFEVDAYGFDEGDSIVLEFREWDPTLSKEVIATVDMSGEDDPGEDGAGGGVDIDDEQLVFLSPPGDAHPVHGHHIRVDAIVTSADGDEYKKTKVFWTGICGTADPSSGDSYDDSGQYGRP